MKRLRHGELRDLTCPRHIVVYWQSGQKHFPVPSLELCSSACYCHPLPKINTNPAWTREEFSICGEQETWWILRWKSVWEKERGNGWSCLVVTHWPSLCKTVCVRLLPRAFPRKIIKPSVVVPQGLYLCIQIWFAGQTLLHAGYLQVWIGGIAIDPCDLQEPNFPSLAVKYVPESSP